MFTGIIEGLGTIQDIRTEGENIHFTVQCDFTNELKIDQSLAHNGVCLTVVEIDGNTYVVTAIKETLDKSNLGQLSSGNIVNLERAMAANGRFDGHVVQGHVDQTGTCIGVKEEDGSWVFSFEYTPSNQHATVEKGSITVNGVSLTVVNSRENKFDVCIIPFTKDHTTFKTMAIGDKINLEFDIIGKYVARLLGKN